MSDPGWLADTQLSSSVDSVDFYVSSASALSLSPCGWLYQVKSLSASLHDIVGPRFISEK